MSHIVLYHYAIKKASAARLAGGFDPATSVCSLIIYPGKIAAGGGIPAVDACAST